MTSLTVLMATFNGKKFIAEQLSSIREQTNEFIEIFVSDDSNDLQTIEAIEHWSQTARDTSLNIKSGPRNGFAQNFRKLILTSEPSAQFISFSDQDDKWFVDKSERSINWLSQQPDYVPALYCGRTHITKKDGTSTGRLSPLFERTPAFENALVQSIAGGNTMTMNRSAFELLKRSLKHAAPISHDWWAYIIVSGAGGRVFYDPNPLTFYRQHCANLVGENRSSLAKLRRLSLIANGTWRSWQDTHLSLLAANRHELSEHAQTTLAEFEGVRASSPCKRLTSIKRSGVWRQTRNGTMSLFAASAMNKL